MHKCTSKISILWRRKSKGITVTHYLMLWNLYFMSQPWLCSC